jgi:hypothetical protein
MASYEFLKEISANQADLIKSFAIFYLIIFSNTVLGLFTCHQINFLKKNKVVLVCIAFLLFYFLVTTVSETGNIEFIPPIQKFIHTIFYFIIFLITTRLDFRIMVAVLTLIFIIYFIELNKDYYLDLDKSVHNTDEKNIYQHYKKYWITLDYPYHIRLFPVIPEHFVIINKIEYILYSFIYLLLILGFIAYTGEIKETLVKRKNLTWFDVFTDTEICNLKERKSLTHYLKVGIGVKP